MGIGDSMDSGVIRNRLKAEQRLQVASYRCPPNMFSKYKCPTCAVEIISITSLQYYSNLKSADGFLWKTFDNWTI